MLPLVNTMVMAEKKDIALQYFFQTRGKLPTLRDLLVCWLLSVAPLVVAVMVGAGAGQLPPHCFDQRQFHKAWRALEMEIWKRGLPVLSTATSAVRASVKQTTSGVSKSDTSPVRKTYMQAGKEGKTSNSKLNPCSGIANPLKGDEIGVSQLQQERIASPFHRCGSRNRSRCLRPHNPHHVDGTFKPRNSLNKSTEIPFILSLH